MLVRERLKELIEQSGLPQAEIARRVGENPNWVGRRINPKPRNKSTVEADDIPRLAKALNRPCSDFFVGSDCPETSGALPFDPSTREARQEAIGRAELRGLSWDDFEAARRLFAAMEALMLTPPESPDDEERAG